MKIIKKLFTVLFVLICGSGMAVANDTAGQLLPTGEIRFEKQAGIILKHEALLLSDTVTVDYLFENTTDKPVETKVFFPVPSVGPLSAYYEIPHDFKFRVWVDGVEIPASLSRRITLNGTDVTKYFNMIGVDSYTKSVVMDMGGNGLKMEQIAEPLRTLPEAEQKMLEETGMIARGCMADSESECPNNPDLYHLAYADYIQEVMYYWTQVFPPHKTLHVRHEYKPSFLENSVGAPHHNVQEATGWTYENPDGFWKDASYIITTANNWKTPIGRFDMLVLGEKRAAVSSYKNDEVSDTRISKNNYLIEMRRDFVPSGEILFELEYALKNTGAAGTGNTVENSRRADKGSENTVLPRLFSVDGPAVVREAPEGRKISSMKNGSYVWAYPSDNKDWFAVLLDESKKAYTHRNNLIPFGIKSGSGRAENIPDIKDKPKKK